VVVFQQEAQDVRSEHDDGKGIPTGRVIPDDTSELVGKVEYVRERASDALERAKTRLMEKEAKFEGYVQEHPIRSVLVAAGIGAGVGLLFGVMLSRR